MTKEELETREKLKLLNIIKDRRIKELEKANKEISNECHTLVATLEKKQNEIVDLEETINKLRENIPLLAEAKEFLKWFVWYFREGGPNLAPYKHKVAEVEEFLKECE